MPQLFPQLLNPSIFPFFPIASLDAKCTNPKVNTQTLLHTSPLFTITNTQLHTMPLDPATPPRSASRRRLNRSSGVFAAFSHSPPPHYSRDVNPLESEDNLFRLQNIAEGVQKLLLNVSSLEKIHHALNDCFNESFAGFLYGLLLNMFCSNYPACPLKELFDAKKQARAVMSLISSLEEKILQAKLTRTHLQEQIAQKTQTVRSLQAAKAVQSRRLLPASGKSVFVRPGLSQRQKKFAVARDDTFSTNDSFVDVPPSALAKIKTPGVKGKTPDLNQAPRYMRGLFESRSANVPNRVTKPIPKIARSAASARAERARQERLTARPPFR